MSNKKTFMLINAINMAEGELKESLVKWIDAKVFDREEKVKAVTRIYDKLGIGKLAQAKINEYFAMATDCLASVSVADERKQELLSYTRRMMGRNH